jgi:hypothetical protein
MSLPRFTVSSVEVRHFDGTNFVSWKSQMSSYLYEINPQVWWMVDVGSSHILEDCPQTQAQKNFLYLEAHTSNILSSVFSAEIKDEIEIEYGLLDRVNLLRKVFEQIFDSSNDKRSSSSVPENMSSSSIHIDHNQEEQLSIEKDKVKSVSLEKSDYPILVEQKPPLLKKMIAPHQVPTSMMMMMTPIMSMMIKSSCWSLKNS